MRSRPSYPLVILTFLAVIALLWSSVPAGVCQAQTVCPVPAVEGRQPYPNELLSMFKNASSNSMGTTGPTLPTIYKGYPIFVKVAPYVPCTLLYAVAYTESAWKQFDTSFGQNGSTLISFDCGYGIMQITGGLINDDHGKRVASEPAYNIGTGALSLIVKWNAVENFVGTNDPAIVEDWYFATWAYNGYYWANDPNNPKFNPNRTPYDGSQPRSDYPYQELVWGFAANPPVVNGVALWPAVALSLPPRSSLTNPLPTQIPRPLPYHTSVCVKPPATSTPTLTNTPQKSATFTVTPSRTPTRTNTPVPTQTRTNTPTITPSRTPSATSVPTRTPVPDMGFPKRNYFPLISGGSAAP